MFPTDESQNHKTPGQHQVNSTAHSKSLSPELTGRGQSASQPMNAMITRQKAPLLSVVLNPSVCLWERKKHVHETHMKEIKIVLKPKPPSGR